MTLVSASCATRYRPVWIAPSSVSQIGSQCTSTSRPARVAISSAYPLRAARNALPFPLLCIDQLAHGQLARFGQFLTRGGVRVHPQQSGETALLIAHDR